MAHSWAPSARVLTLGCAAALVVAAAPAASADIQPMQLPGVDSTTEVFPIDNDDIQVQVGTPDLEDGTVEVSLTNNTEEALTCTGIGDAAAGTVTPASTVAKAVDFYAQYPHGELSDLTVEFTGAAGSFMDAMPFDLGSAVGVFPGSVAEMLNSQWGAAAAIEDEFSQARLDGHFGETGNSFELPAEETTEMAIALQHTSQGERQEFRPGFFMTCVLDDQRYVFHGFDGDAPVGGGGAGSLGSSGLGS